MHRKRGCSQLIIFHIHHLSLFNNIMITSKEAALPNCHILALFYVYDADANNVQLNSFTENSCTEFKRATAWFNGLRYYISKEDDSKDPCCVACPGWPVGDFAPFVCAFDQALMSFS